MISFMKNVVKEFDLLYCHPSDKGRVVFMIKRIMFMMKKFMFITIVKKLLFMNIIKKRQFFFPLPVNHNEYFIEHVDSSLEIDESISLPSDLVALNSAKGFSTQGNYQQFQEDVVAPDCYEAYGIHELFQDETSTLCPSSISVDV
jgi:hypothetical protein